MSEITCDFTLPQVDYYDLPSRAAGSLLGSTLGEHALRLAEDAEAAGIPGSFTHAQRLSQDTHNNLEFKAGSHRWTESNVGDCETFAACFADLAVVSGIQVAIAYCNEHVLNLTRSPDGSMHLINTDNPALAIKDFDSWRFIDHKVIDNIRANGFDQVYDTVLATSAMRGWYGSDLRIDPWLEDNMPAMRIMPIEFAKQALFTYDSFIYALFSGNHKEFTTVLQQLDICNPQLETRPKVNMALRLFEQRLKQWARPDSGVSIDEIVDTIHDFSRIFPDTPQRTINEGNWYALLAKKTPGRKDKHFLLGKSIEAYESVCNAGRGGSFIREKLAARTKQHRELVAA